MERDADPMADGAAQHEKMPDEMHVRNFVHDIKYDTDGICDAAGHQCGKAPWSKRRLDLRKGDDDHPAHDDVDWKG